MANPKLNKRLLRKVRNRIAEIPESYNQNNWITDVDDSPCGTAECLAGEAIICAQPSVKEGITTLRRSVAAFNRSWNYWVGTPKKAAGLLGLSRADAERFFDGDGDGWPMPYRAQFQRAKRPEIKAKIAVAYLDECLKRGKVIW